MDGAWPVCGFFRGNQRLAFRSYPEAQHLDPTRGVHARVVSLASTAAQVDGPFCSLVAGCKNEGRAFKALVASRWLWMAVGVWGVKKSDRVMRSCLGRAAGQASKLSPERSNI